MHKKLWILLLFVGIGFIGLGSCSKYGVVDGCFKSAMYCKGKADYNPNIVPHKLSKAKLAKLKLKAVESRAKADSKAMQIGGYTKTQIEVLKKAVTTVMKVVGRDGRDKYKFARDIIYYLPIKGTINYYNTSNTTSLQNALQQLIPTNPEMAFKLALAYNKSIDERIKIAKCNGDYWLFYQVAHKAVMAANSSTTSYVSPAMVFALVKNDPLLRNVNPAKLQDQNNFWDKRILIYYNDYAGNAGTPKLNKTYWNTILRKYTLNPNYPAYINNTVYLKYNVANYDGGYSYRPKYYHSKNIFSLLNFNFYRNLDLMFIKGNICYNRLSP